MVHFFSANANASDTTRYQGSGTTRTFATAQNSNATGTGDHDRPAGGGREQQGETAARGSVDGRVSAQNYNRTHACIEFCHPCEDSGHRPVVAATRRNRPGQADVAIRLSIVVSPDGEILAEASTEDDELVVADCDLDATLFGKQTIFDFERHRRIEHYGRITGQTGAIPPPER